MNDEFCYGAAVDDFDELVEQRQVQVVAQGGGCFINRAEDPWCILPGLLEPGSHDLINKSASDHLFQKVFRRNERMEVSGVLLGPAVGGEALPL